MKNKMGKISFLATILLMAGVAALGLPLAAGAQNNQDNTPTISNVSPSSIDNANQDTTITVKGTNFVNGSVVKLDNNNLTTNYVSDTELTATVPASSLSNKQNPSVTVSSPDGKTSNPMPLSVNAPGMPNTGFPPSENYFNWDAMFAALIGASALVLAVIGFREVFLSDR